MNSACSVRTSCGLQSTAGAHIAVSVFVAAGGYYSVSSTMLLRARHIVTPLSASVLFPPQGSRPEAQ